MAHLLMMWELPATPGPCTPFKSVMVGVDVDGTWFDSVIGGEARPVRLKEKRDGQVRYKATNTGHFPSGLQIRQGPLGHCH